MLLSLSNKDNNTTAASNTIFDGSTCKFSHAYTFASNNPTDGTTVEGVKIFTNNTIEDQVGTMYFTGDNFNSFPSYVYPFKKEINWATDHLESSLLCQVSTTTL
jgi:hypothetical protein